MKYTLYIKTDGIQSKSVVEDVTQEDVQNFLGEMVLKGWDIRKPMTVHSPNWDEWWMTKRGTSITFVLNREEPEND